MSITGDVRAYWDRRSCGADQTSAPRFSRRYFDEIERYRYEHEPFILGFAKFQNWKGKKVLEVGCGAGTDFVQFARAGADLAGIDLTEEAIRHTAERLKLEDLTANLKVGNAEAIPFSDSQFDLTYSWGVIHHADDTEQCLREIARVTRPGSAVKLMIYNYNSMDASVCALRYGTLNRKRGLWHNMESVGTKAFTKKEALAMAERCGLLVQSVTFGQQLVRKGARFETVRKIIRVLLPPRWGWYMMIDATKNPDLTCRDNPASRN